MAESPNLKNTGNNFLGLSLMLIALAALTFSGALFFDAKFLADLMNVSEGARLGIASGAAAFGLLSTGIAANRIAQPMNDISKKMDEHEQSPVIETDVDVNMMRAQDNAGRVTNRAKPRGSAREELASERAQETYLGRS